MSEKRYPLPVNEPVRDYVPGDSHCNTVAAMLDTMAGEQVDIPLVIGGEEVHTGNTQDIVMPHDHGHVLGRYHLAGPEEMLRAVAAARTAKREWELMAWHERADVFVRAADLLAGPRRDLINAATMLGQSKNVYQAEIDAACEMIDFFRFNPHFYEQIRETQQPMSVPGVRNWMEFRPLEGFVLAITPFNFTSIAGNLPASPALVGNTVIWKPSHSQMLSAWYTMKLFEEAGLPPGVINLIGASGPVVGETLVTHPELAGVHFTGSTATFQGIYRTVGERIQDYRCYPRIVGETGGKDFIFAHASSDLDALATAIVRGAFEYQGQKCSAASRAYIPKSLWQGGLRERVAAMVGTMRMGDPRDFGNFLNAVIDDRSFAKITGYLAEAQAAHDATLITGGGADDKTGYFIEPTVIETTSPRFRTMVEEIFGPVITVYPYDDAALDETLALCDATSSYALTGAIFGRDQAAMQHMNGALRNAAGNFYLNDKPTGAVVGQQPFGGARLSGTNDKAGSPLNLIRWISPRTVKENLAPPTDYRYPHMG